MTQAEYLIRELERIIDGQAGDNLTDKSKRTLIDLVNHLRSLDQLRHHPMGGGN